MFPDTSSSSEERVRERFAKGPRNYSEYSISRDKVGHGTGTDGQLLIIAARLSVDLNVP